ncbi:MAG TPA: hypothetical protein VIT65_20800 [Microlunatus sp.]
MIELRFSGWFQTRLATDPDPYDEPRGVSGYVHAYAGEPDLDRIIHLQRPEFTRTFSPPIGVTLDQVLQDGERLPEHPLLGAALDLLGTPVFEGRNGVIADDGLEPIYPFIIQISKGSFRLSRSIVPSDPAYPYPEYLAGGVEGAPDEIRDATGITDLTAVWRRRRTQLQSALNSLDEPDRTAARERLAFLDAQLRAQGGGTARFFLARMRYEYELSSAVTMTDPDGWLPDIDTGANRPGWPCRFWLGGWDADVLCGFARGTITIDAEPPAINSFGDIARSTDRRP